MELRHLRCFVAVAEELHFGRAATRLHVAQPAVSQTISGLERELGVALFDRNNRRVELTDAGRVLLVDARATLERADALAAAAGQLRSGAAGRVTIGVVPALPPRVLTDVLAVARAAAPEVRVVAKSLARPDPVDALADRRVDLLLARGAAGRAGIATVLVAVERVGLAVPIGHRLAPLDTIPAAALDGEPLAMFGRADDPVQFDRIVGALRAAGLTRLGELHESPVGAVESSLRLVAAREAVSLKLRSEVEAFGDPAVTWRPLDDVQLDVEVHLAWRLDVASAAARRVARAVETGLSMQSGGDTAPPLVRGTS